MYLNRIIYRNRQSLGKKSLATDEICNKIRLEYLFSYTHSRFNANIIGNV